MNVEICGVCCEGEAVFPMVEVVGDEGGAAVVVWRRLNYWLDCCQNQSLHVPVGCWSMKVVDQTLYSGILFYELG